MPGQSKPRSICDAKGTDNELRMNTYTPWATNVRSLENSCTVDVFEQLKCRGCADFIPNPASFRDFLQLVDRLVSMAYDDNCWYVRIGGVSTDFTGVIPNKKPDKKSRTISTRSPVTTVGGTGTGRDGARGGWNNGVGQLDVLIVRNSSYSIRVFDRDGPRIIDSIKQLKTVRTYIVAERLSSVNFLPSYGNTNQFTLHRLLFFT